MLKCSTWNNTPAATRVMFSGRCPSGAQDPPGCGVGVQAHESEGTAPGVEEEPARLVGIYERVYFVNEGSGKKFGTCKNRAQQCQNVAFHDWSLLLGIQVYDKMRIFAAN